MEIRIYYECLEQAYNYISPFIKGSLSDYNIPIKLIKRPKKVDTGYESSIWAIQFLTTPDVLITGIKSDKEYPLVLIEFTEAVTTEDHELQRTYGALAAYLAEMYYIKISGDKKSEKQFGGAEYNIYNTPKILIEKFNYEGFIIAKWQTEYTNKFNLQKHNAFPSCPPEIPILKDTIQSVVKSFFNSQDNWYQNSIDILKKTVSYKEYREKVDGANNSSLLLKEWKEREIRNTNLNKLRYFVRAKWIGAKINRFSHAMDPDRGILTFISFVFSQSYSIYGIYALVRSKGNDILKKNLTDLNSLKIKFKEAIKKDRGGIPQWFVKELEKIIKHARSYNEEVNFQHVWEKYQDKIIKNKVVLTIAYFLDGLYLNHNGIKLCWDRYKLLKDNKGNIFKSLKKIFGFNKYSSPLSVEKIVDEVDEDEVTYAITHRVLIVNKFKIISISYPGSQGSGAILPEPEKGKAQPREYPDIIAVPPDNISTIDVLLNESKGMFKHADMKRDIKKMIRYKKDNNLVKSLKDMLVVANILDKDDKLYKIVIGIAFGIKSNTQTTWKPDEVDFIFRIVDRKNWAIGIFNQELRDLITTISGTTNFPVVYKILK